MSFCKLYTSAPRSRPSASIQILGIHLIWDGLCELFYTTNVRKEIYLIAAPKNNNLKGESWWGVCSPG
jgi:hypothetical protein